MTLHLQEIAVSVARPALTPFCLWIWGLMDALSPRSWACPKTIAARAPAVQVRPSSIPSKTFGNTYYAIIGSPTGFSPNYNDILDHCCFNWNKLVERPWLIMSIGTRRWAHG